MATIEPIGHTEFTAHKEREILRLKVNEIIEALNGISINNAKITLKQGSAIKGDFTLNQPIDKTIVLDASGSAGGFVWGEGTGIIDDQADLKEKFDVINGDIIDLENGKVDKGAIATSFGTTPSNDKVPSEKLVKTSLDGTMKLTGNQTIAGIKTFTEKVALSQLAENIGFSKIANDMDVSVRPTTVQSSALATSLDKNSVIIGQLVFGLTQSGKTRLVAHLRNLDGTMKTVILAESD